MASFGGGTLKSLTFTDAWGISPGSGQATMPGYDFGLSAADDFSLTFGSRTIHGTVKNPVRRVGTDGIEWEITLVDNREKLTWDSLACQLNIVDIEEVDPTSFGKTRRRRYKHILPNDWHAQIVTYTQNPLTAAEVLDYVFDADTLQYGWSYLSHAQLDKPVYNLDYDTGTDLAAVIQTICDKLGLVVGLSGKYQLQFVIKGTGSLPPLTGANIKVSSSGVALSGNPKSVRIIGDRDLYTDTGIALVPDWGEAWESYLFEPDWIIEVKDVFSMAYTTPSERAAVAAKARTVTVQQWVTATGDSSFADHRRFGDVGRMNLPAWVYITQIVFKAYKIDPSYTLNGIDLQNLKIHEGLLARVTATTGGVMSYFTSGGSMELYTDDKAFIIATGQQLDLSDPAKREILDPSTITSLAKLWTPCQRFRIDPRNYSVIFEDAVFQPGEDDDGLFIFVNADTDLPPDHPSKNLAVPNADAVLSPPDGIMGAFCFEAERYSADYGSGLKFAAHYVSGLNLHALMLSNVFTTEIEYDTLPTETVAQKAQKAAAAYLAKAEFYASGSLTRLGAWGTRLTGVTDRVSYTLNTDGISEVVDLTKERAPDYFESERELDRAKTSDDLYQNMRANREEARLLEYQSRVLAGLSTKQSRVYRDIPDVFKTPLGNEHHSTSYFEPAGIAFDAGEVVFTNDAGVVSLDGKVLQGIVVTKNVTSAQPLPVATQGVVATKISGVCAAGALVGADDGAKICKVGGTRPVGVVMQAHAGTDTVWLPVKLGSSGGTPATPCQFRLYETTNPDTHAIAIGVSWGIAAEAQPEDFHAGGKPAFLLPAVEGEHWVYARVVGNVDSLQFTSVSIIQSTDPGLMSSGDTIHRMIGSYNKSGATVTIEQARCGPVNVRVCELS